MIPAQTENLVEADAELLGQKLRLVSNVTSADMRAVKLSIDKDRMTVYGRSAAAPTGCRERLQAPSPW